MIVKKTRLLCGLVISLALGYSNFAFAASDHDPVIPVLIGLVALFLGAKAGGYIAIKLNQPAVLGELLAGVCLGNLTLAGFNGLSFIGQNEIFAIFAGIGVVLLLFEVGLESSLGDLMRVGISATIVAIIGVITPFILGFGVSLFFMPDKSHYVHAFVGATLCATSVGITARVLKDLGKIHLQESKVILGAAVIDDVLGLIILAIVSGVIVSAGRGGESLSYGEFILIAAKSVGFLVAALLIGKRAAPVLFRFGAKLRMEGMLLTLSLSFCFLMAYLSSLAGLAPIVGAFAAGLIIDGTGYSRFFGSEEPSIEDLLHPVSKFFVPIFFVHMGMQVDLKTFADVSVILLGISLSVVAILGKQVCGLGIWGKQSKGLSRLLIGIGMIPRGEVGLIFAVIGAGLVLNGEPIVSSSLYSAIVLMVMITTMLTPPGLKWAIKRRDQIPTN